MGQKPKSYKGHAAEFNDPVEGPIIRSREKTAAKMLVWEGEPEVERICESFIKFLWETSKTTSTLLKEEKMLEEKKKLQLAAKKLAKEQAASEKDLDKKQTRKMSLLTDSLKLDNKDAVPEDATNEDKD